MSTEEIQFLDDSGTAGARIDALKESARKHIILRGRDLLICWIPRVTVWGSPNWFASSHYEQRGYGKSFKLSGCHDRKGSVAPNFACVFCEQVNPFSRSRGDVELWRQQRPEPIGLQLPNNTYSSVARDRRGSSFSDLGCPQQGRKRELSNRLQY